MSTDPAAPAASAPSAGAPAPDAPPRDARAKALSRRLFGSPASLLATATLIALAAWALPPAWRWLVADAVWRPDAAACHAARAAETAGACWGVVAEKGRAILFGRYPAALQWRPAAATVLLLALVAASCRPSWWRRGLALAWAGGIAAFVALMGGGIAGLAPVETDRWGGLPLTLMLSTLSMALAFPLAVAVALGRRSGWPALRALCTVYLELVRGVPLVSVLFMASFMFPLLLPAGTRIDVLLRVLAGLSLFAAAYMAEVVRGGLQAVPASQFEAAQALGLRWWPAQRHVVLPQALAAVVPGIVNHFIGLFKDTSLVTIVSLYELTGAMGLALDGDADWRPFKIEAYLFIAAIYFGFCFAISRYSRAVERRLARGAGG